MPFSQRVLLVARTVQVTACLSSQPDDGGGDGHTTDDCAIVNEGRGVCVRAERAGDDPAGRTYTITIEASDGCGNAAPATATIYVPHDQSPHEDCRRPNAGKRLTSVFPSTTAAAIPTFMTGLAPAQHALTGWHMWLDELQAVTAILPLTPRSGPPFAEAAAQLPGKLFDHRPIYSQLHRAAWVLSPRDIALSPFNVFHTRGADTLAYGDLDELMSALGRAQLADWVASLPDGLDTFVGEAGTQLSGGQRQRLVLARALLADAPVLVLDEPTAHLDPATARSLMADVLDAAGERTVLLITHRPEGLERMDEVVALDADGRITPRGRCATAPLPLASPA